MSTDIGTLSEDERPTSPRLEVYTRAQVVYLRLSAEGEGIRIGLNEQQLATLVDLLEEAAAHAGVHWPRLG